MLPLFKWLPPSPHWAVGCLQMSHASLMLRILTLCEGHEVFSLHFYIPYFPFRSVYLISSSVLFRESENRSSACSQCTSITVHITPILGQLHRLSADARISCICMPLFQRCYLFHSCLSLWSPTTVLSFSITSFWYRHPSPATPTLLVQDGRWVCILSFGPSVRSSLPLHVRNATTIETF